MSTAISTGFFYGWAMTYDEMRRMVLNYNVATDQAGDIEDCFTPVNSYANPRETTWLFGTWISYFPEPGHWRVFHPEDMLELPDEEWCKEFADLLRLAGEAKRADEWQPRIFAVSQIW